MGGRPSPYTNIEGKIMDVELLKKEISEANDRIAKERAFVSKTGQDIAEYLCPFAVGDRVINQHGEEKQIACIDYQPYGRGYSFKVFKLKTNGKPYKNSQHAWAEDKYTKA